jgi:ketosteroid isomerase-like protein
MTHTTPAPADADVRLRRLLDEADIRAVIARFARAADRGDSDLVRSCYHPDGTDAHGHYNGDVDGFVAYTERFSGAVTAMTHFLGQSTIELDGDEAWVETYCLCLIRMPADDGPTPVDRLANIRYVDLFARRDGEWRIAHRKVVHHPGRIDPVAIDATFAAEAMLARMDGDDPSYDRRPASFLP